MSFGGRQEQEHVLEHEDEHGHEHHVQLHEDEHGHEHLEDLRGSERTSCRKSIDHEATVYQGAENSYGRQEHNIDYINCCTSDDVLSGPKLKQEDDTQANCDASMGKHR
jgi:hypothetical protein